MELQRVAIGKMSDSRLKSKLAAAGYNPEDLAKFDRPALLSAWADLVASGVEQPDAKEGVLGYPGVVDMQQGAYGWKEEVQSSLEERQLILEERRLEEQRLQREEQRLQREQEDKHLELKDRELELNKLKMQQEETHRDSTVTKLKLWGDALRNTITKMPVEPVRPKSFTVGEQVLILSPDSTTSKVFSKWPGPATVIEVISPHSYLVEIDGSRRHLHADKLRRYHINLDEVICKQTPGENTSCGDVSHCAISMNKMLILAM